jgi:hypothetical protein
MKVLLVSGSKKSAASKKTAPAPTKLAASKTKNGHESNLVAAARKRVAKDPPPLLSAKLSANRDKAGILFSTR